MSRSKKQKATGMRAWRILQMRGALAFMNQMNVNEDLVTAVEQRMKVHIDWLYYEEIK